VGVAPSAHAELHLSAVVAVAAATVAGMRGRQVSQRKVLEMLQTQCTRKWRHGGAAGRRDHHRLKRAARGSTTLFAAQYLSTALTSSAEATQAMALG
jgi:hypothetical protein